MFLRKYLIFHIFLFLFQEFINRQDTVKSTQGALLEEVKKESVKFGDDVKYLAEFTGNIFVTDSFSQILPWQNALPIEELGSYLNKEQFWDAIRLRYNLKLDNLPTQCPCGQAFNVAHALNCKKGGFVSQRHENIKNLLVSLLSKVC